jgi:hypothetical protein
LRKTTEGWRDPLCSWIGRINIVKMAILPKAIYRFNEIPIKILMTFITEIEKSTLKFVCKHKRPWITQQKEQCWRYPNTQLQTILPSNSKKTAWYWHKNRHEDQTNKIEDPDMNPHNYAHLIFDKGPENFWWRKDSLVNKCCLEKWLSIFKNWN